MTTRKSFLKRAGLAFAGAFAFVTGAKAMPKSAVPSATDPHARIKTARGIVERQV